MFIEGWVNKEYLRIMKEAGYDIVWVAKTPKQAAQHGYKEQAWPFNDSVIARIFLDQDIEHDILPWMMAETQKEKMLPLMAVSSNTALREYATKELAKCRK